MAPVEMADTYMCRRCGALVANSAANTHGDWHQRIESVVTAYEDDVALAAERMERPGE